MITFADLKQCFKTEWVMNPDCFKDLLQDQFQDTPEFYEVLSQFKTYINRYGKIHNHQYREIRLFSDGTKILLKTIKFKQLNELIDSYLAKQPKPSLWSRVKTLSDHMSYSFVSTLNHVTSHPWQTFSTFLLLQTTAASALGVMRRPYSDIQNVTGDTCQLPASIPSWKHSLTCEIMDKVHYYDEANTPSEKVEDIANSVLIAIDNTLDDPSTYDNTEYIFGTENFSLVIADDIEGGISGFYDPDGNSIAMTNPATPGCFNPNWVYQHEKQHAVMGNLQQYLHPHLVGSSTKTEPFNTELEQTEFENALNAGHERVTTELRELHGLAQLDLLDDQQLEFYQHYKQVLIDNNYQPRCYSQLENIPPAFLPQLQSMLAINKKLNVPDGRVITELRETDKGIMSTFYLVDPYDREATVDAFIRDTQRRIQVQQGIYSQIHKTDDEETKHKRNLKEHDAEVHANHSKIRKTFYKELEEYHKKFREKHERATCAPTSSPKL